MMGAEAPLAEGDGLMGDTDPDAGNRHSVCKVIAVILHGIVSPEPLCFRVSGLGVQGYLAHKKHPTPQDNHRRWA